MDNLKLGNTTDYSTTEYKPDLLDFVPRSLGRSRIGDMPEMYGNDIWNAYEFCLLEEKDGVEYAKNYILKIVYPSSSEKIVESKSLKLFLNTFAFQTFTVAEAIEKIETPLKAGIGADVKVHMYPVVPQVIQSESADWFKHWDFDIWVNCSDPHLIKQSEALVRSYQDIPEVPPRVMYWSPTLRSNCPVTNQPDWGDLLILMKSPKEGYPLPQEIQQKLMSIRNEQHFHEECIELLYTWIMNTYSPQYVYIVGQYLRRGGIDIVPTRSNVADTGFQHASSIRYAPTDRQ